MDRDLYLRTLTALARYLLASPYTDEHLYFRRIIGCDFERRTFVMVFKMDGSLQRRNSSIPWVMGVQTAICIEQLCYIGIIFLIMAGVIDAPGFDWRSFAALKGAYSLKTKKGEFSCRRTLLKEYEFVLILTVPDWGIDGNLETDYRGIKATCQISCPKTSEVTVEFFAPTPRMLELLRRLAGNAPGGPAHPDTARAAYAVVPASAPSG
jgi:hypothetical protein